MQITAIRTSEEIAIKNDEVRRNLGRGAKSTFSQSVSWLYKTDKDSFIELIHKVRSFDKFDIGNNPHGERDYGKIEHNGKSYMFKIDYYDSSFEWGADPYTEDYQTLITILEASEY
jgi:hypothetical protein